MMEAFRLSLPAFRAENRQKYRIQCVGVSEGSDVLRFDAVCTGLA
jgi:hypothetical protein